MTRTCGLFEALRESNEAALRGHARACPDCAAQLSSETAIERLLAAEPPLSPDLPPLVFTVRRRSLPGAALAAGVCIAALAALVLGSRMDWTPAVMLACAGCVTLALVCADLVMD